MTTARLFRIALQVSDLDQAAAFYARLLDDQGIRIQRGSRHYFNYGGVIVALGHCLQADNLMQRNRKGRQIYAFA